MKRKLNLFLVLIIIASMVLGGCSSQTSGKPAEDVSQKPADNSSEVVTPDGEFKITGLEDGEVVLTAKEIYEMDSVTEKMTNISSSGEITEAEVTGVKLDAILSKHNVGQKDFEGIRFFAGDGYSIIVPKEILDKREIMLIYKQDGQPLNEEHLPLRVAVPDERSMYWVGNLSGMEIVQEEIVGYTKVMILESAYDMLNQEDYVYYEATDKAIKIEDLFSQFVAANETDKVTAVCVDGLEKDEKRDVFVTSYIKTTGEYAPLFIAPELPKGMQLKELLWFADGENSFFSIEQGIKKYADELVTYDDNTGLPLTSIEDSIGLQKGENYRLTAADGYSVEIDRATFEKGMIYPRNKGGYSTAFDGMPKNTKIKGIVSIEVIDGDTASKGSGEVPKEVEEEATDNEVVDFSITVNGADFGTEEAKELEYVKLSINKMGKDGELKAAKWQGYKIKDILTAAGITEYTTVTVSAADGFSSEISKDVAEKDTTLIGFIKDGETLENDECPTLTVDGEGSKSWIKGVASIEAK